MEFFYRLFSTQLFMAHGYCYYWDPTVVWLHVISDGLIVLAYYSIPLTLIYFVRKRKDLVFNWIFLFFAMFILACGTTHLLEIIEIWCPLYRLGGVIKAITAFFSIVTAIVLWNLMPKALALPSSEQLTQANSALQKEINEHRQTLAQTKKLYQELQLKASQLESVNKELETFSYSVSHDLRAPLRHIEGFADLLEKDNETKLSDTGKRFIEIIKKSVFKMSKLIDDLLLFSRMGRAELQTQVVNFNPIITEVIHDLTPDLQSRNVVWSIETLPMVQGDYSLLKQVWVNLLSNAVKYTRRTLEAKIAITGKESEHEYEFSIQDNGAGFDMQYIDKLFGIFQRLHRHEEFEGTGIGLAHAKRIIMRHGGKIWAHSSPDQGATFTFTIPKNT